MNGVSRPLDGALVITWLVWHVILTDRNYNIMKLTEKQFCKAYTEFYGDEINSVKQIAHIEFENGKDLFEFAQEIVKLFAIPDVSVPKGTVCPECSEDESVDDWQTHFRCRMCDTKF